MQVAAPPNGSISVSGVVHYVAEDEADALEQVRTLLAYLPSSADQDAPR